MHVIVNAEDDKVFGPYDSGTAAQEALDAHMEKLSEACEDGDEPPSADDWTVCEVEELS